MKITFSTLLQHWTGPVLQSLPAAAARRGRARTAAVSRRENMMISRGWMRTGEVEGEVLGAEGVAEQLGVVRLGDRLSSRGSLYSTSANLQPRLPGGVGVWP